MTVTDLLLNMGAILAVIPAISTYNDHGLLAAVGMYAGVMVVLVIIVYAGSLLLSFLGDRSKSD